MLSPISTRRLPAPVPQLPEDIHAVSRGESSPDPALNKPRDEKNPHVSLRNNHNYISISVFSSCMLFVERGWTRWFV